MKKYDERLLNIEESVGSISMGDLKQILFDDDYRPKWLDVTSTIPAKDPKDVKYGLDYDTLVSFGKALLKHINQAKDYLLIELSIPSEKYPNITHAVALGVDKIHKKFYFNNSYGIDLRKDIKDLILGIFPNYGWGYSENVQQCSDKKDNSCAVLTIYNLLDMLDRFQGNVGGGAELQFRTGKSRNVGTFERY
ncbi:MAG: hypothetical protein FWF97_01350 [Alphaproteobacteria bacterium]|nr:hypothetical protein [Alphaproteobacteria bacterium]